MVLRADKYISMPEHTSGGFDHADVYLENGYVYVAHTANGTVEVIDGVKGTHIKTIPGCPQGSGVVCAQKEGLVFVASRSTGKILVINARKGSLARTIYAGVKPNGLAWDSSDGVLLVTDIGDLNVRLVDPEKGQVILSKRLQGRPRWCAYSWWLEKFLINIQDPPGIILLQPRTGALSPLKSISVSGPHGLALDEKANRALIGCSGGAVVVMDLESLIEKGSVKIPRDNDVLWFNPTRSLLYCALWKPGQISVIDTISMKLAQVAKTEEGAGTLAFDSSRQRLYSFWPKTCRTVVFIES